jgi:hypothetical protein
MPWAAIGYVTTGLTLCAFVVAVIAGAYKKYNQEQRLRIESALPQDRADLVSRTLEGLNIDVGNLSKEQQYDIAVRHFSMRIERFRIMASVVVILALISASLAGYSIFETAHAKQVDVNPSNDDPKKTNPEPTPRIVNTDPQIVPHPPVVDQGPTSKPTSLPPMMTNSDIPIGAAFVFSFTKNDGAAECIDENVKESATVWHELIPSDSPAPCHVDAADFRFTERVSDDASFILLYEEGRGLLARLPRIAVGESGPSAWRLLSQPNWNAAKTLKRIK